MATLGQATYTLNLNTAPLNAGLAATDDGFAKYLDKYVHERRAA